MSLWCHSPARLSLLDGILNAVSLRTDILRSLRPRRRGSRVQLPRALYYQFKFDPMIAAGRPASALRTRVAKPLFTYGTRAARWPAPVTGTTHGWGPRRRRRNLPLHPGPRGGAPLYLYPRNSAFRELHFFPTTLVARSRPGRSPLETLPQPARAESSVLTSRCGGGRARSLIDARGRLVCRVSTVDPGGKRSCVGCIRDDGAAARSSTFSGSSTDGSSMCAAGLGSLGSREPHGLHGKASGIATSEQTDWGNDLHAARAYAGDPRRPLSFFPVHADDIRATDQSALDAEMLDKARVGLRSHAPNTRSPRGNRSLCVQSFSGMVIQILRSIGRRCSGRLLLHRGSHFLRPVGARTLASFPSRVCGF